MKNLYEGDPFKFIWNGEWWQAFLWVFVLVFGVLWTSNLVSLVTSDHGGGKYGITRLPTNMIGDAIVFPLCGLGVWYFYQNAKVGEDHWLVSNWPSVIGLAVALVLTALFVWQDIRTNGGNWITVQHPKDWPNPPVKDYNIYGWIHACIFCFVAYFLATAGVKAGYYLAFVDHPWYLVRTFGLVLFGVAFFFGVLVTWDRAKTPPFWYHWLNEKVFHLGVKHEYESPTPYPLFDH